MADPRMKDSAMPLTERIKAAIDRITKGHAAMRIPVEATDPDVVLADCLDALSAQSAIAPSEDWKRGATMIDYVLREASLRPDEAPVKLTVGDIRLLARALSAPAAQSEAREPDSVWKQRCEALAVALSPLHWTQEMSRAWHVAIPDVHLAFENLATAALKDLPPIEQTPQMEAMAPAGYVVILPDKASAPMGYWFVGAWNTKETATEVASKHPGAEVRCIQFMNKGASE